LIISNAVFERIKSLGISNGVFLFVSNDKQSLEEQALSFAHRLLDYHSDDVALNERIFNPKGDFITAEVVNDFIQFEAKKSVGVQSKILIMHDVDLVKDNVSDKMLKCIEDYSDDSLIIFTTTSIEKVSRTIKSRCMVFKEWSDSTGTDLEFINALDFIPKLEALDGYSGCKDLLTEVQDLSAMSVIHALFLQSESGLLSIAKNALDAHLTGSNDSQVLRYIINSIWCLRHGLRKWELAELKEAS